MAQTSTPERKPGKVAFFLPPTEDVGLWFRILVDSPIASALARDRAAGVGQADAGAVMEHAVDIMDDTKHQDLHVLGSTRTREQRQPAQNADEHQVDESEGHSGDQVARGDGR